MVEILFNALNQNLVQFELKPGVEVIVYVTQLTLGECGVKCISVVLLRLQTTPGEPAYIRVISLICATGISRIDHTETLTVVEAGSVKYRIQQ